MENFNTNLMKDQLSRVEMKTINGGKIADGCQSVVNGTRYTGLSVADAQGDYQFCVDNGYSSCGYCCASC
ncbi:hypothetical protein ESY86_14425 [Subsaximicrobium wynnwilliamsii]|uniref:Uncharacterized protein n=1 Tax=Subsaximicrobium wynnwilliamsii TaxID=291179 RepID=A0A5C6ZHG3_9FLAO|nr:hypothetical protein [Subsaximicrobium wynnwilliamsii]TXD82438.1 hypothetical protein ESY87_14015 [Subsaximicrobium wynnwilliamsii]TXD88080.1 hypothetical protein ESY86_14425 [Subsaximicrobium wynnwilliamsii]TXE02058.1 hypothetical protein ESY88_13515 [Subsaximicrobium wynnwilliamsii]